MIMHQIVTKVTMMTSVHMINKQIGKFQTYIVSIDCVGVLTNKAISNLPKINFIVIDTHIMIQKALNVTKGQFELSICEADTDKTCKNNGVTLNKRLFYAELNIHSEKYSDKVYSSSGDDYLPYEWVGLCYKTDCSQGQYCYSSVLAAKIAVTLSRIKELNPKWLESYYLTDKTEIVFVTQK